MIQKLMGTLIVIFVVIAGFVVLKVTVPLSYAEAELRSPALEFVKGIQEAGELDPKECAGLAISISIPITTVRRLAGFGLRRKFDPRTGFESPYMIQAAEMTAFILQLAEFTLSEIVVEFGFRFVMNGRILEEENSVGRLNRQIETTANR